MFIFEYESSAHPPSYSEPVYNIILYVASSFLKYALPHLKNPWLLRLGYNILIIYDFIVTPHVGDGMVAKEGMFP